MNFLLTGKCSSNLAELEWSRPKSLTGTWQTFGLENKGKAANCLMMHLLIILDLLFILCCICTGYLFYGLFLQDLKDPLELLHPRNVNKTALYEYIRHGGTLRL